MTNKYDYIRNFLDLEYYTNIYTEERKILHEKIIDKYFQNICESNHTNNNIYIGRLEEPNHNNISNKSNKLIFTSGSYGCGKSKIISKLYEYGFFGKYIYVDPDKIRRELPEYNDELETQIDKVSLIIKTNQEAFYIGEVIRIHAMFMHLNVIYDSSMRNFNFFQNHISWIKQTFQNQTQIIILHIDIDISVAIKRYINKYHIDYDNYDAVKKIQTINTIKQIFIETKETNQKLKNFVSHNIVMKNNNIDDINTIIQNNFEYLSKCF